MITATVYFKDAAGVPSLKVIERERYSEVIEYMENGQPKLICTGTTMFVTPDA